jgi:dethiobiotin synthetase
MRGLFVTATDTGVGKSVLSATLLAAMSAAGEHVAAYKPAVTGLDQPEQPEPGAVAWPPDHELLALAAGGAAEQVSPLRFGPAVSPHLAASMTGVQVEPAAITAAARHAGSGRLLVVEGVGGLLVPLTDSFLVRDLAAELGLPVVIAARPGLGTINHTLLTLAAAREAGLDVRAIVLTPWPQRPGAIEDSNAETIARLGGVEVSRLGVVAGPSPQALAAAGEALPWRGWLAEG